MTVKLSAPSSATIFRESRVSFLWHFAKTYTSLQAQFCVCRSPLSYHWGMWVHEGDQQGHISSRANLLNVIMVCILTEYTVTVNRSVMVVSQLCLSECRLSFIYFIDYGSHMLSCWITIGQRHTWPELSVSIFVPAIPASTFSGIILLKVHRLFKRMKGTTNW